MTDILVHNGSVGGGRPRSRREFFRNVGLAVVGSVLLATGIKQLSSMTMLATTPALVRSTFAPYVGDTFHVQLDASDAIALQLIEVRDLLAAHPLVTQGQMIDAEQSFSILFHGPAARPLGQDTYHFTHSHVGEIMLFIVPMRRDNHGCSYEAVFNRMSHEA